MRNTVALEGVFGPVFVDRAAVVAVEGDDGGSVGTTSEHWSRVYVNGLWIVVRGEAQNVWEAVVE